MEKIGNELVSGYTSSKQNELLFARDILKRNLENLGLKWRTHIPVFLGPSEVARMLWFDYLVQKIIEIPGIVVEFGSQWGASFATINSLLQIHDTWNPSRRLISFSTFSGGFMNVEKNIDGSLVSDGDYAVNSEWLKNLQQLMQINAMNSPIGNNTSIIEGDAMQTFEEFLATEPNVVISMVHFDMDIYKPTKRVLELCLSRMPKGSLLVFDEINHPGFPGETQALDEVLGVKSCKLRRSKLQPYSAYIVVD
jgi:hypothetical protein